MAVASGSPVHAQLNATLTAPDLCPKVAPSPRAQSSSFVTAALPSVSEFIAIEPPIGIATPFGNETPSQSSSPVNAPKAPSPSKPPPPNSTVREAQRLRSHRFRNPPRPKHHRHRIPSPGPLLRPPRSRKSLATLFGISKSKYSGLRVRAFVSDCCAGEIFDGVGSSIAMGVSFAWGFEDEGTFDCEGDFEDEDCCECG